MGIKRQLFLGTNRGLARLPDPARKVLLSLAAATPFVHRPPRFMAVEPTNACNLECPLCPVGAGTMDRPRGFMDLGSYRKLIDEVRGHVTRLLMNFAGEPLLHPRIGDMVRYAEEAGIRVTLGTHGNIDRMDDLVAAGTSEILFSLDGTSDEVYRRYRVGGNLDTALSNLRRLVAARDARPGGRTRVILQFVVMSHNQHQIPEVVEIGRAFGVDEISLQPVCVNDFFDEPRAVLARRWVPASSPYLLHPETGGQEDFARPPLCIWAIQSVVLFNGDVTICCFDTSGRTVLGNAFEPGGFSGVWNGREYRRARGKVLRQDFDICRDCDVGLTRPTRFPPDRAPTGIASGRG